MYNFYPKEEIEMKLSKHYMDSVIIDADDGTNGVMLKVGTEPFVRKTPDEIAKIITNNENSCAFVEYEGLMVFKDKNDMDNYKR